MDEQDARALEFARRIVQTRGEWGIRLDEDAQAVWAALVEGPDVLVWQFPIEIGLTGVRLAQYRWAIPREHLEYDGQLMTVEDAVSRVGIVPKPVPVTAQDVARRIAAMSVNVSPPADVWAAIVEDARRWRKDDDARRDDGA